MCVGFLGVPAFWGPPNLFGPRACDHHNGAGGRMGRGVWGRRALSGEESANSPTMSANSPTMSANSPDDECQLQSSLKRSNDDGYEESKKARKKPTLDGGETPITIGGGGGLNPKEILPLTIQFDPNAWTQTKGLLTLIGGNVRRIRVTAGDEVDVRLPVTGDVQILLKCGKPLKPTRP